MTTTTASSTTTHRAVSVDDNVDGRRLMRIKIDDAAHWAFDTAQAEGLKVPSVESEKFLDGVADRVEEIERRACKESGIDIEDLTAPERHTIRASAWAGFGLPL